MSGRLKCCSDFLEVFRELLVKGIVRSVPRFIRIVFMFSGEMRELRDFELNCEKI